MNITELPIDVFLLIVAYLSPTDLILNRCVSRRFYATFAESELSRHFLLQHYPRARELHDADPSKSGDWARIFARVASRYHHLKTGTPRRIEKLALRRSLQLPSWARFYPVAPWQRYLQFEEKTAPFHYPDPLWTFDEGLLVLPSSAKQRYLLYDLGAGTFSDVDFEPGKKIVRRIRLNQKVLVVEWCEPEPYHQLNENETVFRHFATAFDIVKDVKKDQWNVVFRNEWKIHFLGMPLNSRDRFFSTHNTNHYAMYLWQPNRSAWGEDEPIEALAIWDISSPSSYRPSEDPSGRTKPDEAQEGARAIRRFSFADLDFYNIRQWATPVLRSLELDENHVYVIEEDHRWIVGQQAGHTLPRLHKVKTIGIPFYEGPRWEDECGADGNVNISFCERASDFRRPYHAPCWRHEVRENVLHCCCKNGNLSKEFPYLTITEAIDVDAGVCYSARQCFMLETISISVKPRVHMTGPGYDIALRDDLWQQLLGKGKICGDERWLIGENASSEVVILHFDGESEDQTVR